MLREDKTGGIYSQTYPDFDAPPVKGGFLERLFAPTPTKNGYYFECKKGTPATLAWASTDWGWFDSKFTLDRTKDGWWTEEEYTVLFEKQRTHPISVMTSGRKRWWWFMDRFYWEDEDYEEEEVRALVLKRVKRKKREVQRAIAELDMPELSARARRESIPDKIKIFVWQRDTGMCVQCGSQEELEYDHIIPLSMGGSNTARNLQLLCAKCNKTKGGNLT